MIISRLEKLAILQCMFPNFDPKKSDREDYYGNYTYVHLQSIEACT